MPLKMKSKNLSVAFPLELMFYSACQSKDFEDIETYLLQGADVNYHSSSSLTALHQACIDENIKLCLLLLNNGANPNLKDEEGWTSLHVSASINNLELTKLLCKYGALVSIVNYDGDFPVELATDDHLINFLNEKMAAEGVDREKIKANEHFLMLRDAEKWTTHGVPEKFADPINGVTSLHVACAKGYTDVVELLLEMNVDLDVQDFDGWTPLHAAVHNKHVDICTLLINAGADTTIRTNLGESQRDLGDADLMKILDDLIVKNYQSRKLGETHYKKQHLLPRYSQKQKIEIKAVDNTNELNQIQSLFEDLEPPKESSALSELSKTYFTPECVAPISSIQSKGLRHRLRMLDQFHKMVENDDSLFSSHKTTDSTSSPLSKNLSDENISAEQLSLDKSEPLRRTRTPVHVPSGTRADLRVAPGHQNKDVYFQRKRDFEDSLVTNSVPYRLRFPDKDIQRNSTENCCTRCSKLKIELEDLRVDNELMNAQLTSHSMENISETKILGNEKLCKMVDYLDRICRLEDENRRLTLENDKLRSRNH